MPLYYEIEDGEARLVSKEVLHAAPVKDFAALLATPRDNNVMFLPANTRHVLAEGASGRVALVIELPPSIRTLTWGAHAGARRHESYTLALPWVYFVFGMARADPDDQNSRLNFANWGVYCARQRIMSLTDPLKALPVNNVYNDGRICFGSAAADPGTNIGQHIDNLVTNFWNTDFNYDVWPTLPGFVDYKEWEKTSAADPTCWLKWPWDDINKWNYRDMTIEQIVRITADRVTAVDGQDPIPPLPMNPTFGRAEEWFAGLTDVQRERLRAVMAAAQ